MKIRDRAAIYMGMTPELPIAMLACARIGGPHSVVFGGFSSNVWLTASLTRRPLAVITQQMRLPPRHRSSRLFPAVEEALKVVPQREARHRISAHPVGLHVDGRLGALIYDDVLHAGARLQRFFHGRK